MAWLRVLSVTMIRVLPVTKQFTSDTPKCCVWSDSIVTLVVWNIKFLWKEIRKINQIPLKSVNKHPCIEWDRKVNYSPAHKVQKAPESFDLLIIQGCYYNCTLIASLSHDIFGILYWGFCSTTVSIYYLKGSLSDRQRSICWLEAVIASVSGRQELKKKKKKKTYKEIHRIYSIYSYIITYILPFVLSLCTWQTAIFNMYRNTETFLWKKKKKNVSSVWTDAREKDQMPDFRLTTKHHKNLFICNLRPFQDYFNYFELIQSVRWMKIEVLGESCRRVWCGSLIIRRNDEIWQTA